jgi:hydrogenase maturation protease
MGIGNYLMGDEGVGVHVAQRLARETLPEGVDVLDGGTGGFFLMEYFENYPVVILIDATLDDRPTGTIRVIEPRFAADFPRAMSTHDIGLRDLVEGLAILGKMPKIYLFAVSIEMIQSQQIELSPELERVMPELLEQVKKMALRQHLELVY